MLLPLLQNNLLESAQDIESSLLEDIDTVFHGYIQTGPHPYHILNVASIVGLGDFVDLIDEIILASASGAIIGKHKVQTESDTLN